MRTVMWGDPSGTIFWIESCREGGWFAGLDPSVNPAQSSAQRAPILAMKNSGNALATSCVQQGLETYWQRKHGQKANDPSTGRASILFCDGHAGQYIPEATIGADKKDSQGNPGSMNDADAGSGTVRGMWTNLGGD